MGRIADLFSVKLSTPVGSPHTPHPLTLLDLSPWVEGLTFSSVASGGFEAATITLGSLDGGPRAERRTPTSLRGTLVAPFGHVEIRAQGALVWEGRAMRFTRTAGEVRQIVCAGYGPSALTDGILGATSNAAATPYGMLVLTTETIPTFAQSDVDGPTDKTSVTPGAYNNATPFQVLDGMCQAGITGTTTQLWWFCWEGRHLFISEKKPPAVPDYRLADDERLTVQEDYTGAYSTVTITYTDSSNATQEAIPPATNSDFVWDYGIYRAARKDIGTCTTDYATQFQTVDLALHAAPSYQATVTRTLAEGMDLVPGGIRPPYLVRAGEWVQLGSIPSYQPVVRAEYDAEKGTGTFEIGGPSYTIESLLASMRYHLQYQQTRIHPISRMPV